MIRQTRPKPNHSFHIVPSQSLHYTVSRWTSSYRNSSTSFHTLTSRSGKIVVHSFSRSSIFRTKRRKPRRSFHIVPPHSLHFTLSTCSSTCRNLSTSFYTVTSLYGRTLINSFSYSSMVQTKRSMPSRSFHSVPAPLFHFTVLTGTRTYRNLSTTFHTVTLRSGKNLVHPFQRFK